MSSQSQTAQEKLSTAEHALAAAKDALHSKQDENARMRSEIVSIRRALTDGDRDLGNGSVMAVTFGGEVELAKALRGENLCDVWGG